MGTLLVPALPPTSLKLVLETRKPLLHSLLLQLLLLCLGLVWCHPGSLPLVQSLLLLSRHPAAGPTAQAA
jgi:hypothetical protein